MEVIIKPVFERDSRNKNRELIIKLKEKLLQISNAKNASQITGIKLLRGYSHHYKIKVISKNFSFRIGAVIRGNKIWLVRFLPRKKIYRLFP